MGCRFFLRLLTDFGSSKGLSVEMQHSEPVVLLVASAELTIVVLLVEHRLELVYLVAAAVVAESVPDKSPASDQ